MMFGDNTDFILEILSLWNLTGISVGFKALSFRKYFIYDITHVEIIFHLSFAVPCYAFEDLTRLL